MSDQQVYSLKESFYKLLLNDYEKHPQPKFKLIGVTAEEENKSGVLGSFVLESPTPSEGSTPPEPYSSTETSSVRNIAIVGAGVCGLYIAMLLDHIGGIDYTIFESNNRVGGRIFTHTFPTLAHPLAPHITPSTAKAHRYAYAEMGPMRFPRISDMSRLFNLFKRLGLKKRPYRQTGQKNGFLYFNGHRINTDSSQAGNDPFCLFTKNGEPLDSSESGVELESNQIVYKKTCNCNRRCRPTGCECKCTARDDDSTVIYDLKDDYTKNLDALLREDIGKVRGSVLGNAVNSEHSLKLNATSLRQELLRMGYPSAFIDTLQILDSAPGHYDQSYLEAVFKDRQFRHSKKWVCIDKGSKKIPKKMLAQLKNKDQVLLNTKVTGFSVDGEQIKVYGPLLENGEKKDLGSFDHVINTTTLPIFRNMDTTGLGLTPIQKTAVSSLKYDHAAKIAVLFRTRWWESPEIMKGKPIHGGYSKTDLRIRVISYPSHGLILDKNDPSVSEAPNYDKPGSLLISYTGGKDATQIGLSLASSAEDKNNLMIELLQEVATVHDIDWEILKDQVYFEDADRTILNPEGYKIQYWNQDPHTLAPFCFFGPGQFLELYNSLNQPMGTNKRFHLAGEALSIHHGWIAGALDSAVHVLKTIFPKESKEDNRLKDWDSEIKPIIDDEENIDKAPTSRLMALQY